MTLQYRAHLLENRVLSLRNS